MLGSHFVRLINEWIAAKFVPITLLSPTLPMIDIWSSIFHQTKWLGLTYHYPYLTFTFKESTNSTWAPCLLQSMKLPQIHQRNLNRCRHSSIIFPDMWCSAFSSYPFLFFKLLYLPPGRACSVAFTDHTVGQHTFQLLHHFIQKIQRAIFQSLRLSGSHLVLLRRNCPVEVSYALD